MGNGDGTFGTMEKIILDPGFDGHYEHIVGDFDGVNGDDLGVVPLNYSSGYFVKVVLNNGNARFQPLIQSTLHSGFGGVYENLVGDFNGDGKDDVGLCHLSSQFGFIINVATSNGDGTFNPIVQTKTSGFDGNYEHLVGDFNGDGKDDIGLVHQSCAEGLIIKIAYQTEDGFGPLTDVDNCGENPDIRTFSTIITSRTDAGSPDYGYNEHGIKGLYDNGNYVILSRSSAPVLSGNTTPNTQITILDYKGDQTRNFVNNKNNPSGVPNTDNPQDIIKSTCADDTGKSYILTGYSGGNLTNEDLIFEKIASNSVVSTPYSFNTDQTIRGEFITEASDGAYLIGGTATDFSNGVRRNLFLAFGDACNSPTPIGFIYNFGTDIYAEAATEITLGNGQYYAITGKIGTPQKVFILVVNKSGDIVFGNLYPFTFSQGTSIGYDIIQKSNGHIAILGQVNSSPFILELRYRSDAILGDYFEVLRSNHLDINNSGIETADAFVINHEGNYVISGTGFSNSISPLGTGFPTRAYLLEVNETDFSVNWSYKYINPDSDFSSFSDIELSADGGYFCVGAIGEYIPTNNFPGSYSTYTDIYALKTGENGNLFNCDCYEDISVTSNSVTVTTSEKIGGNRQSLERIPASYTPQGIAMNQDFCDQYNCETISWSEIDFNISLDTVALCAGNNPDVTITPKVSGGLYPDRLDYDLDCDGTYEITGKSWSEVVIHNFGGVGSYNFCVKGRKILNGDVVCDTVWEQTIVIEDNLCLLNSFQCGMAVATCFSDPRQGGGPVAAIFDVRPNASAPIGSDWNNFNQGTNIIKSYHPPQWDGDSIGQVFGIAINKTNGDIFLAATDIYRLDGVNHLGNQVGPAGTGGIYRTRGNNLNNTSVFVSTTTIPATPCNLIASNSIPNTGNSSSDKGNGIGNIVYDQYNDQLFATNTEDGRIYQIDILTGNIKGIYDPFGTGTDLAGKESTGELLWGVGVFKINGIVRVYFARQVGINVPNELWSIALDLNGDFTGTLNGNCIYTGAEVQEITAFPANGEDIITDIAFSNKGKMLVTERGKWYDAHVYEYVLINGNWVYNKEYFVGQSSSNYSNSAGGVDYGYAENNNDYLAGCDSIVWTTGNYMSTSNNQRVYGIKGVVQPCNDPTNNGSTDIFIDLDQRYDSRQKYEIGDVEVFRCTDCPKKETDCKKLSAAINVQLGFTDICCYPISLFNDIGSNITKVEVELLNPNWVMSSQNLGLDFSFDGTPTNDKFAVTHSSGSIPTGWSLNAFEFCIDTLDNQYAPIQKYVVKWYETIGQNCEEVVCVDTLTTECIVLDTFPPCIEILETSIECNPENPLEYFYNFKVKNNSNTAASSVVLQNISAGYTFSQCSASAATPSILINLSPNPVPAGNTSNNICVKIIADNPSLVPTSTCFYVGLLSADFSACCHAQEQVCVELVPCCDPCDDISIVQQDLVTDAALQACCTKLDVINHCQYEVFTKIETKIITSGVIFGYHAIGGPSKDDWASYSSSDSSIDWVPINSAMIPNGFFDDLIQFCLDDIDQSEIPQEVELIWYGLSAAGIDTVLCRDTLIFECDADFKCLEITEPIITCNEANDKYNYTFTVTNQSSISFSATDVHVQIVSPADLQFIPTGGIFPLTNPLDSGQSETITTCIESTTGTLPNASEIVFKSRLAFTYFSSADTCCFENVLDTLTLPSCGATNNCGSTEVANPSFTTFSTSFSTPDVSDFPTNEWIYSGVEDCNGDFAVIGALERTIGPSNGDARFLFAKLDQNGQLKSNPLEINGTNTNIQFAKEHMDLIEVANCEGYVAATSFTENSTNYEVMLLRFDLSGNVLWTKKLTVNPLSSLSFKTNQIIQDSNGDFVIVGDLLRTTDNSSMAFVMRWNENTPSTAPELRQYFFNYPTISTRGLGIEEVTNLDNFGYMITGQSGNELLVLGIHSNLQDITSKTYNLTTNSNEDIGYAIKQIPATNELLITGETWDGSHSNWVTMKITGTLSGFGNVIWAKKGGSSILGQKEVALDLDIKNATEYFFSGYQQENDFTPTGRGFLHKMDNNGDLIWSRTYNESNKFSTLYECILTNDGGFALFGDAWIYDLTGKKNKFDTWIGKTDMDGLLNDVDCFDCEDATLETIMPNSVTTNYSTNGISPVTATDYATTIFDEGIASQTYCDQNIVTDDSCLDLNPSTTSEAEGCCFFMNLTNNASLISQIDLEPLASGIIFSNVQVASGLGFSQHNNILTVNSIPARAGLPQGMTANLFNFCLDNTTPNQAVEVALKYYSLDPVDAPYVYCVDTITLTCQPVQTSCSELDSLVLVDLYNDTDGANWTSTWDLSQPMDSWHGVFLNSDRCVLQLFLNNNNLDGTIPKEVGNLSQLQILSLANNPNLTGSIPAELGNLSNLQSLLLYTNQLIGSIPTELGNLNNLQLLWLNNTNLTGSIPAELGSLSKLSSLDLAHNQLTGTIPIELGNLDSLQSLILAANQLNGIIPVELGNLSMLHTLTLSNNQLTSTIPSELGSLNKLKYLILSNNQLTGSIPSELENLDNLEDLWLQANQLAGVIPIELGNLNNIQRLYVNSNQLSGCFPTSLNNYCNISYDFSNNPNLPGGGDFAAFCANSTGSCSSGTGEDCNSPINITINGAAVQHNLSEATDSGITPPCVNGTEYVDTWFATTADENGSLEISWSTPNNLQQPYGIAFWRDCSGNQASLLQCNTPPISGGGNGYWPNTFSPNQTVYIQVWAYQPSSEVLTLETRSMCILLLDNKILEQTCDDQTATYTRNGQVL